MHAFGILFLIIIFLCWGSFLNALAYRLMEKKSLLDRSACPSCHHQLAWYHLVPLASWFMLKGHCAFCQARISLLYPVIELITALACTLLAITVQPQYVPIYIVFFSALIITIRTDIEYLSILNITTIGLLPFGLLASVLGYLPVSPLESCIGIFLGGGILWVVRKAFWYIRHQEGLGWGDIELLAAIGCFVGILGVILTLLIGSIAGSLVGIGMYLAQKKSMASLKIPFGAFLAGAAIITVLWCGQLVNLLL